MRSDNLQLASAQPPISLQIRWSCVPDGHHGRDGHHGHHYHNGHHGRHGQDRKVIKDRQDGQIRHLTFQVTCVGRLS